jgi:hypothetical protein
MVIKTHIKEPFKINIPKAVGFLFGSVFVLAIAGGCYAHRMLRWITL